MGSRRLSMLTGQMGRASPQRDAARLSSLLNLGAASYGAVMGTYLLLPGLQAFYPMTFNNPLSPDAAYTLSFSGNAPVLYTEGVMSYLQYQRSATKYMYKSNSIFDYATATWADNPGLTVGAWVRLTSLRTTVNTGNYGVVTKWKGDTNHASYILFFRGATGTTEYNYFAFDVSSAGTGGAAQADSTYTPTINEWAFVVGRWTPSTENAIFVKGWEIDEKVTNTTSVPASIFASTTNAEFRVGSYINSTGGNEAMDGYISLPFLSFNAIPDEVINNLFFASRRLFGGQHV